MRLWCIGHGRTLAGHAHGGRPPGRREGRATLLALLRGLDPAAHDALAAQVFVNNHRYNDDPAVFEQVYEELLLALESRRQGMKQVTAVLVGAGGAGAGLCRICRQHPEELRIVAVAEPRQDRRKLACPGARCWAGAQLSSWGALLEKPHAWRTRR